MLDLPPRESGALLEDTDRRPLEEITGDIRDRLTTLLNTTQVLRLTSTGGDPDLLSGLRLIQRQVECLGRLADELGRD